MLEGISVPVLFVDQKHAEKDKGICEDKEAEAVDPEELLIARVSYISLRITIRMQKERR